jgi:hypothetical protein
VRRGCAAEHARRHPKQLATFKAIHKSIEVAMGEGQWNGGVAVYFDVTPVTN